MYILCIHTPFLVIHMYWKNVIMSMLSEILYGIHNRGVYYQGACLTHCFFGGMSPDIGTVCIIIPVPSDSVSRRGPIFYVRENDLYTPRTPMPVIHLLSEIYLFHKKMYNAF